MSDYQLSRRAFGKTLLVTAAVVESGAATSEGWVELFDGHSMSGWRPSEHKTSWSVIDGALTANGPRSHLFYTGPVQGGDFRNFELEVELTTQPECNSGVYFHTAYQESGFPEKGFEIQVNNTARGDGGYLERKKTGSLYGLRNMYKQLVPDQKPFRMHVSVRGKNVQIRLNGQLLVDYVEPTPPVIPEGGEKMRFLDHGTFALQCHNDGSKVAFRSVRVRPLPNDLPAYVGAPPVVDQTYREIINIGRHNIPMVDYHVFLRNGMTLDDALRKSRKDGIQYGITALSTQVKNDADVTRWIAPLQGRPVFFALSAQRPDWMHSISQKAAQQFDYLLADGRTWTDQSGRSVRLWMPEETKGLADNAAFVDALVEQTIERLEREPLDLYTFPTYLPESLKAQADALWTESRMSRLIEALVKNQVAIELNTSERLPSRAFIERAKQAGCKFGFGTGNETAQQLQRCEYGLEMVEACKLDWHNFYAPGAWWPKAADARWRSA